MVPKVSCQRTENLQPGTAIIKNLQYNDIFNMTYNERMFNFLPMQKKKINMAGKQIKKKQQNSKPHINQWRKQLRHHIKRPQG